MKFNFYLPAIGRLATPGNLRRSAIEAEALGFVQAKMGEHLLFPKEPQSRHPGARGGGIPGVDLSAPKLESLTTFAFLAGHTTTLRFETSVLILPIHSPFEVAVRTATLDYLSNGRFTLGVGTGWMKDEYDILHVPFRQRGRIMDEYIAILRTLFESDGPFSGEYFSFPEVDFSPKPVQKPFPIHIASHSTSDTILRRVAKFGQAWLVSTLELAEIKSALPRLREFYVEYGRDANTIEIHANWSPTNAMRGPGDSELRELERFREHGVTSVNVRAGEGIETELDGYLRNLSWFAGNVMKRAESW